MGNVWIIGEKRTFKWRIEGFSPLQELPATSYSSRMNCPFSMNCPQQSRIENLSELPRLKAFSRNFIVGGHIWKLQLWADRKNNRLGIILELYATRTLPFKSELYAEFSLCLLDQINGKHKKFTGRSRFTEEASKYDWTEILPLDDFLDASMGFLVKDGRIIEASVTVIGSSTRP